MIIFKDDKKQLNINPLVVYFIMTPKEKEEHAKDINRLNRSKMMNHDLFEFNTVVRAHSNHKLTEYLIKDMEENNVIVKLFGNDTDEFTYAFETIEYRKEYFETQVENFLFDVCNLNVNGLKAERKRLKDSPVKERKKAVETLLKSFTSVINELGIKKLREASLKTFSFRGSISNSIDFLSDHEHTTRPRSHRDEPSEGIIYSIPHGILEDINYATGSKEGKKKEDAKKRLIAMIEGWFGSPSSEYSKKVLTGAYDDTKAGKLEEDHNIRHASSKVPNITIEIKKIKILNRKDGTTKEKYGFVYNIDGESVEMYIGGTEPCMIYACTLLKQYAGSHFYLDHFKIKKTELTRRNLHPFEKTYLNKTYEWIKQVYYTFNPFPQRDFEEWYSLLFDVQSRNPGHPIFQGKSACNSKISKTLKDHHTAIYFCSLQQREDTQGTFYEIDLPSPNSIIIAEELLELVPEAHEAPAHARPENGQRP